MCYPLLLDLKKCAQCTCIDNLRHSYSISKMYFLERDKTLIINSM